MKDQEKAAKIKTLQKQLFKLSPDERESIAAKYGIITVTGHPLSFDSLMYQFPDNYNRYIELLMQLFKNFIK